MTPVIDKRRIGKVLAGILGSDQKPAIIINSMRLSGDFPKHPGIVLKIDYAMLDGDKIVYLQRQTGRKTRHCGHWSLRAIQNADIAGLKGLNEFAASLGWTVVRLRLLVNTLKPE